MARPCGSEEKLTISDIVLDPSIKLKLLCGTKQQNDFVVARRPDVDNGAFDDLLPRSQG